MLIWPDFTLKGTDPDWAIWLEITVKEDVVTGLQSPDVFYFANSPGESGNSTSITFVDGTDFARARDNQRNFLNPAPIDFPVDYNRDRFLDGTDMAVARNHNTNFLTALKLLNLTVEFVSSSLTVAITQLTELFKKPGGNASC